MYASANLLEEMREGHNYLKTPFVLFGATGDEFAKYADYHDRQTKGIQHTDYEKRSNLLSKVFFDPRNVETIQRDLIFSVFQASRGRFRIEPQNPADIMSVMETIFSTHAKHLPRRIKEQASELNRIVVERLTPNVLENIRAQAAYQKRYVDQDCGRSREEGQTSIGFDLPDRPSHVSGSMRRQIGAYLRFSQI